MQLNDYMNMIKKIAWKKSRATGVDLDDLIQNGVVIFLEVKKEYDETKGCSFSTHLYNRLNNNMLYMRECDAVMHTSGSYDESEGVAGNIHVSKTPAPHHIVEFTDSLDKLSKNAKKAIQLIFESPADFLFGTNGKKKHMVGAVRRALLQSGIPSNQAVEVIKEIRAAI